MLGWRLRVLLLLGFGDRNLEILESQLPVIFAELLGPFAVNRMVEFGDQMLEALDDLLEIDRLTFELPMLTQQRGDSFALRLGDGG